MGWLLQVLCPFHVNLLSRYRCCAVVYTAASPVCTSRIPLVALPVLERHYYLAFRVQGALILHIALV